MLADPEVSHFFASTDMSKQRCRMKQFLSLVTGGPNEYEGTDMKIAHCKFNIWKSHFDKTWANLEQALLHFNVAKYLIGEVKDIFYSVEEEIVKNPVQVKTDPLAEKCNKEKPQGCPFSSKQQSKKAQVSQLNCPFKLTNNVYMKSNY